MSPRRRGRPCRAPGCTGDHRAHGPVYLRPLPETELVRLRRLVGLPDTGPTDAMRDRWTHEEAQMEAR